MAKPTGIIGTVEEMPFEDFVATRSARLFTMATLLSGRHRAKAEDLLQEVLERAYRRWARICRSGDPERYVRQMLVNSSIDRWRRLRRRPRSCCGSRAVTRPLPISPPRWRTGICCSEPSPPSLMEAIRRRHRRYRRRAGAGCVLAVAALALAAPSVTHALRATAPAAVGRASVTPGTAVPMPMPTAAPGTVLSGCGSANPGDLGSHWRAGARAAGPLWFLDGGHGGGRLQLYVVIPVIAGVRPGSAVVVRIAPEGRPYLRFLFGPNDSLTAGTRYTMRSGEAGVTFFACQPGSGAGGNSGAYTDYYGGMLIRGQRCVPVDVWPPGAARPVMVRLGACAGWGYVPAT